MFENDLGFDPSIKLQPIDEFGAPLKLRRNTILYVAIACGVLLSVVAMFAIVWELKKLGRSRAISVTVTSQRDRAELRQESVTVFGNYDASDERLKMRSPEEALERTEILELFHRVEACALANNNDDFHNLVDFDRQLKRVELTGGLRGWTEFDKRSGRTEMKNTADVEPFWGKITVADIVRPPDDPYSRVVYAYTWNPAANEQTEYRFWIARVENSWKLYDWARLDLGLSESDKWGMYAKFADKPETTGFHRWGELIRETDKLTNKNDRPGAMEKLRLAESQLVPNGFQGFRWVLTGHRWMALNESSEAERCYHNVPQPNDTPGAYYGLMQCARDRNSSEALKYAELYEAAVGPNPDLSAIKAALLEDLGRDADAINEWKNLLRMEPANTSGLTAVLKSLPKDDKTSLNSQLERIEDPVAAVVEIAPSVAYRDYQRFAHLVEYLDRKAPAAAGTFYAKGLAKHLDGQYGDAATFYRKAFQAEKDDEKRQSYIDSYVEAMIASGRVLEVWKTVPDPKSAFDSLFFSYDEGDIELTEDEFRQLIALYRKQFPDDMGGFYREAAFEIAHEKYGEAEALLRKGLRLPNAKSEDESESYRDSLASSLATAVYKQGRVKEAFDVAADQKETFSTLVRLAITDRRWNDVRSFVEMQRTKNPSDSQFHYAAGELAAHEKHWEDAIRHYQECLKSSASESKWLLTHRLQQIYVESGRWMEYYKSAEDRGDTFDRLAVRFVSNENWGALNTLLVEHTRQAPDDIRIAQYDADAAWAHEDYRTYIQRAQQVLAHKGPNAVQNYERTRLDDRLLGAMLRGKQFDLARQFAERKQREQNDSEHLALVNAAVGNWAEANRWARQAAAKHENASVFYSNADLGHVFLGNEFDDLHHDFPVEIPYAVSKTVAVLLLDQPLKIDAGDIAAALKDVGLKIATLAEPIKSTRKDVTRAFALPVGEGEVWLATGEGKYFKRPDLSGDKTAILQAINKSQDWLAIGVASWRESDRKQAESVARRLAVQLTKGHLTLLWSHSDFCIVPASGELLTGWQSSGKVDAFKEQAVELFERETTDVATNREFDRKLHEAVRSFESSPGARFEVAASLIGEESLDPLRLAAKSVRRSYGNLEFDGILKNQSNLVPQLREGLPMRFESSFITAWRLNDEAPMYRRPIR